MLSWSQPTGCHSGVFMSSQGKATSLWQMTGPVLIKASSCFRHLWNSNIGVLAVNKLDFRTAAFTSQNQQEGYAITKHL